MRKPLSLCSNMIFAVVSILFVVMLAVPSSLIQADTLQKEVFSGNYLPSGQVRYAGPFHNSSSGVGGSVIIDISIGSDTVSGYINFTNDPDVGALCGAGSFSGTRSGDQIQFSFTSNDSDYGCTMDDGWVFNVNATLSGDEMTNGSYSLSNGQNGTFSAKRTQPYNGRFTNTSNGYQGNVHVDLALKNTSVAGYIDFTNDSGDPALCGAGSFSGTRDGDTITFDFLSNDFDSGCTFDDGWTFEIGGRLSSNDITNGTYYIPDNGQSGTFYANGSTQETYSISGKIEDHLGNPIPSVTVSDNAGHTTTTNDNGNYTLSGLSSGTYRITPTRDGFTFSPSSMSVSVPPSATGRDFKTTFVVDGYYPDPDGYQFKNRAAYTSWEIFRDTFGASNVEYKILGRTIRKPAALRFFYSDYRRTGQNGNCSSMAASSMLLYKEWTAPSDFLSRQGVNNTIQLPEPPVNNGYWVNTSDITKFIVRYQGYQLGRQVQRARSAAQGQSVTEMLTVLKSAIDGGLTEPQYISIRGSNNGPCAGHALMPYAYEEIGLQTRVYVYDSNHPYGDKQYIVLAPSSDFWMYDNQNSLGIWRSGQNCKVKSRIVESRMNVLPLSAWREHPIPPWLGENNRAVRATESAKGLYNLSVSQNASLRIEDNQGNITGNQDGELVSNIPGSYLFIPDGATPGIETDYPEKYVISGTSPLTISIFYSDTEQTQLNALVPGGYIDVMGTPSGKNVTDTVRILPDASKLSIVGGTGKDRQISILQQGDTYARQFAIDGFALFTDTISELSIGKAQNVITFTSNFTQSDYSIQLNQIGYTTTRFVATGPEMHSDDIHAIKLDWNRLITATVEIDRGGDGTVDESVILRNRSWQIYLPLVSRY